MVLQRVVVSWSPIYHCFPSVFLCGLCGLISFLENQALSKFALERGSIFVMGVCVL